ncbi:MAG TPA: segregation/condensation protein A [Planctomycetaceae bacterium]|nr:segregation/condensation protein A [Planctomycetaceae bacterium]
MTTAALSAGYRVDLDGFAGPLDLLLYLVRRSELDVTRIPIAKITAQFLTFLEILQFLDFDLIGDFVVVASTLVEIKSRQVLPQPEEDTAEPSALDDDPKGELITRLLAYKRYKEAASALDVRATEWQQRYPRLSDDRPTVGRDHTADPIREVELWDLVSALSRVLHKRVAEQTSAVRNDDTPIHVYVGQIADAVRHAGPVPFSQFFAGTNRRSRIIGIFLAILELLRHHAFRAEQPEAYGEIYVLPPVGDETNAPQA